MTLFEQLITLKKERKKLLDEAKEYRRLHEAQSATGKLSGEELRTYNQKLDKVEDLGNQIEAKEQQVADEERGLSTTAKKRSGGADPDAGF